VLAGGLTVNLAWCLYLNFRNRTTGDYAKAGVPLAGNFLFAAVAGAIWCSQFICFKTGEPAMGQTAYVGWALLMACSILFSSLLGAFFLGEWRGTGRRTRTLLAAGLGLLILTAVLSGYSGYLALA
jgi:L-rhamnose-H+ transport protein